MKVLLLMTVAGVISPTSTPFSTRQYAVFPSQPVSVFPSKIGVKPGSSPARISGRSLCFGAYGTVCADSSVANARIPIRTLISASHAEPLLLPPFVEEAERINRPVVGADVHLAQRAPKAAWGRRSRHRLSAVPERLARKTIVGEEHRW